MTDTIHPWLDPLEVRRLAESLMSRPPEPLAPIAEAGFTAAFVGFETPPPTPAVEPIPHQVGFQISARGPFLEQATRFRDWLRTQYGATGIFILDHEGRVIFDESGHGKLHFLARSLALASRRQRSTPGNVHVKITAGSTLEVIPVDTAYGCLVLGAVVPEALSPHSVAEVMAVLAQTSSPPGSEA